MKVKLLMLLLCGLALAENEAEKKLIEQYPRQAEIAVGVKFEVEKMTTDRFGRNARKDESDAFRHFVGAGLLYKRVGPELAEKFLAAHETGPGNTKKEREMDFKNNVLALKVAAEMDKAGNLTPQRLADRAIELIKSGELVVVRRMGLPKPTGAAKEVGVKHENRQRQ